MRRASSRAPSATWRTPRGPCGWRRRSVGEPGLKIRRVPSEASSGMCEWPNATSSAAGNLARIRGSRPAAGPLSWIIATGRPSGFSAAVSAAPQAATSGPSLLPTTAVTGAYCASSSSTAAVHTSPACRIRSAPRNWAATAGGQDFQRRGACVSDSTTIRIVAALPVTGSDHPTPLWPAKSAVRPGDLQAEGGELVERAVVAALDVVHAVQHRRPVGHRGGEHRGEAGPHVRQLDLGALQLGYAPDDRRVHGVPVVEAAGGPAEAGREHPDLPAPPFHAGAAT